MDSRVGDRECRTVDVDRMNRYGAATMFSAVGLQTGLHLWLFESPLADVSLWQLAAWVVGLTALHEVVHGVGYRMGGARWSQIDFGFEWRKAHAWAGCRRGLAVEDFARALLLPLLVTGLVPWVMGLVLARPEVALAGALLTAGATGDVLIWLQTRSVPRGTTVYDADGTIGFEVDRARLPSLFLRSPNPPEGPPGSWRSRRS